MTSPTEPTDSPLDAASSSTAEDTHHLIPQEQWLQDLELLHHWTTSTYSTLTSRQILNDIWQNSIPRMAVHCDFLMHSILAVAALHLAHVQPESRRRQIIISSHHQTLSLSGFRAALNNVNPQNGLMIMASSLLIALFAAASSAIKASDPNESLDIDGIADLLVLLHGIHETLTSGEMTRWIAGGVLQPMLTEPAVRAEIPDEERQVFFPKLAEIRQLIERTKDDYSPDVVDSLNGAMNELEKTHEIMLWMEVYMDSGYIMMWTADIKASFISLLRQRHPIAVIILCYYCALLHYSDTRWIWDGWAPRAMYVVIDALPPEWQSWAEWPKAIIEWDIHHTTREKLANLETNIPSTSGGF